MPTIADEQLIPVYPTLCKVSGERMGNEWGTNGERMGSENGVSRGIRHRRPLHAQKPRGIRP